MNISGRPRLFSVYFCPDCSAHYYEKRHLRKCRPGASKEEIDALHNEQRDKSASFTRMRVLSRAVVMEESRLLGFRPFQMNMALSLLQKFGHSITDEAHIVCSQTETATATTSMATTATATLPVPPVIKDKNCVTTAPTAYENATMATTAASTIGMCSTTSSESRSPSTTNRPGSRLEQRVTNYARKIYRFSPSSSSSSSDNNDELAGVDDADYAPAVLHTADTVPPSHLTTGSMDDDSLPHSPTIESVSEPSGGMSLEERSAVSLNFKRSVPRHKAQQSGTYDQFPVTDRVLVEFARYLRDIERNHSKSAIRQMIVRISKFLYFVQKFEVADAKPVVIKLELLKPDHALQYVQNLYECGFTGDTVANYLRSFAKFLDYISESSNASRPAKEAATEVRKRLRGAQKGSVKQASRDRSDKEHERFISNDPVPTVEARP